MSSFITSIYFIGPLVVSFVVPTLLLAISDLFVCNMEDSWFTDTIPHVDFTPWFGPSHNRDLFRTPCSYAQLRTCGWRWSYM